MPVGGHSNLLANFNAVQPWHYPIDNRQAGCIVGLQQGQGFAAVAGQHNVMAALPEKARYDVAHSGIVVSN
jgi:hypothetical protein